MSKPLPGQPADNSVNGIRETFLANDTARDAGLTTPEDIIRYDNVNYGDGSVWNLTDIYTPRGTEKALPTIISIHGGGWVYGTKEIYQFYCMSLAQKGFTVVNFNYHLAPEDPYPQGFYDVNTLFNWVDAHADEYHIDRNNIFTVGDSAGGQLNSQYLAFLTNPEYQKLFPITPPTGLTVRAAGLNCGVYDMKGRLLKENPPDGLSADYFGGKGKPEYLDQLDALPYITDKFPPSYVMTAYYDFIREAAMPMVELLRSRGVEVAFKMYGSEAQKDIGHVFHCNIRSEEATKCNNDEAEFFKKHIVK